MADFSPSQSLFLQAGSSEELVAQLRALSQLPESVSLTEFMVRFAHRFEPMSGGQRLRTDDTDVFIADLMACGWLRLRKT